MRRGNPPLRRGASAICKAVFAVPGASFIAALLPAHSALAQATGVITGTVNADYSTSVQNGQTVYGFNDASANLSINIPNIPVTAATGTVNWSSANTWNFGTILLANGGIVITGQHASDAGAFMIIPTAAQTLVNTGPTEFSPIIYNINLDSTQVPGDNASFTLSPFVSYDVTIPANSNVNMDQQGVAVHAITLAANGTLTGDGNFTVRSDLVNNGQLLSLAGTVQGDLINQNFSDVTGALYVQGNFNNTGTANLENGSSLNPSNPFANAGTLNLFGGTINPPTPMTNNGIINAYNLIFPSVTNSHSGVIDIIAGGTPYAPPDTVITNAGLLKLETGSTLALDGQVNTFNNQSDPVTLNNLANGTVQFLGDGAGLRNQTSGSGFSPFSIFNNAGLLIKTAGSGLSTVDAGILFNDTGTIEVDSGTLQINGGGGFTSSAFVFKNNSQLVLVNGYTVTGNNTASGTGGMLITFGSLFGGGTLSFTGATQVTLSDNSTVGNGLTNAGNMQIGESFAEVFITGTFINTGTVQHTLGTVQVNAGSTFVNSGTVVQIGSNTTLSIDGSLNTFTGVDSPSVVTNKLGAIYNLQGDGQVTNPTSGFPLNPDATFNNFGLFEKTAGTGTSLVGPGMTFNNSGTVNVATGTVMFTASVTNAGSITIAPGARVTFASPLSGATGAIANMGTMDVNVNATTGRITGNGALMISIGGNPTTLQLAANSGTSRFSSIAINPNSTLDIQNNTVAINFGSPANDPVATIAGYLANGYNSGSWTGSQITSTTAAFNPSVLAVGYADGNKDIGTAAGVNQILVKYTLVGDANLDGLVNFNDLVAVVQNFNKAGADWAHGNFNYGASTNFNDLVAVVQNFNKTLTPAGSSGVQLGGSTIGLGASAQIQSTDVQLPEPGSLLMLSCGTAGLLSRRRRKSTGSNAKAG